MVILHAIEVSLRCIGIPSSRPGILIPIRIHHLSHPFAGGFPVPWLRLRGVIPGPKTKLQGMTKLVYCDGSKKVGLFNVGGIEVDQRRTHRIVVGHQSSGHTWYPPKTGPAEPVILAQSPVWGGGQPSSSTNTVQASSNASDAMSGISSKMLASDH